MASQSQVAEFICVSQVTVSKLAARGVLQKQQNGTFDLQDCLARYLTHLRAQAEQRNNQPARVGGLAEEKARLAKEMADGKAMDNAEKRKQLIPAAHVQTAWHQLRDEISRVMLALPGDMAPLLVGMKTAAEAESVLMDGIIEALEVLSSTTVKVADEN